MIEEHISKPRLMFENYPTFLVADTNCFVNHLNGLKAIVGSQCFTLIVPLIGKRKEHQRGDLLIFNRNRERCPANADSPIFNKCFKVSPNALLFLARSTATSLPGSLFFPSPGNGKERDPGNEVGSTVSRDHKGSSSTDDNWRLTFLIPPKLSKYLIFVPSFFSASLPPKEVPRFRVEKP